MWAHALLQAALKEPTPFLLKRIAVLSNGWMKDTDTESVCQLIALLHAADKNPQTIFKLNIAQRARLITPPHSTPSPALC
jgi:hypothetical protein